MRSKGKEHFIRVGLPLIVLTVGGWFGVSQFFSGRFDAQDAQRKELDLRAPVTKQRAKKFNLEDELQRLKQHVDLSDYKNKPVPRPKDW